MPILPCTCCCCCRVCPGSLYPCIPDRIKVRLFDVVYTPPGGLPDPPCYDEFYWDWLEGQEYYWWSQGVCQTYAIDSRDCTTCPGDLTGVRSNIAYRFWDASGNLLTARDAEDCCEEVFDPPGHGLPRYRVSASVTVGCGNANPSPCKLPGLQISFSFSRTDLIDLLPVAICNTTFCCVDSDNPTGTCFGDWGGELGETTVLSVCRPTTMTTDGPVCDETGFISQEWEFTTKCGFSGKLLAYAY